MYFKSTFFEDYILGDKRVTFGRTITETDFVVHAGIRAIFFRTTWMPSGAKPNRLNSVLRMAP